MAHCQTVNNTCETPAYHLEQDLRKVDILFNFSDITAHMTYCQPDLFDPFPDMHRYIIKF